MEKTWILVANAHRARCFERDGKDSPLAELADFVEPRSRVVSDEFGDDPTGEAGKGHGRTAHSGTQFEPHTSEREKERADFAAMIADYLNEAAAAQRCDTLALIASSPMLGALKHRLNPAANKLLKRCISGDFTRLQGNALKDRIDTALALPD